MFVGLCILLGCTDGAVAEAPEWSGRSRFRVLVQVPPVADLNRRDELIARCEIPLNDWLRKLDMEGSADLSSFQVHRIQPNSRAPLAGVPFHSAISAYDRPCRYEDDLYPQSPSRVGRASEAADGRAALVMRDREARLFNREHRTDRGRLIWLHEQTGNEVAQYAIYFDVVEEKRRWGIPISPWLGDGDVLRLEHGAPIGGFSHFTASPGDLNDDGLFDIVAGNEKGDLFWYPNRGTVNQPVFAGCQFLEEDSGPIDTGWYAAPLMYDWDSDGRKDLLVGTSGNVILWWRNVGTSRVPRFEYRGFVQADGKRLEVPESPVAEDSDGIFARDYFNQPWAGDLSGDGIPDLVTGGYTTGRFFWYRSEGRRSDGTPTLRYAGNLEDESGPIDTIWAAAPTLGDFDHDGNVDLLTGAWWWSGIQRQPESGENDLLWYFRGRRNSELRGFTRLTVPRVGDLPMASIARPTAIDVNNDGLVDLFVSESGGNAYVFPNVGTKDRPQWDLRSAPLTVPWGFTRDFDVAASAMDVNNDGSSEFLIGNVLHSLSGPAASPSDKVIGTAHVDGQPIEHAGPGYGDPYYHSIFYDWDGDSHADIFWGTQQGNVYFHRGRGAADPLSFSDGVMIRLTSGEPLRVGPPVVTPGEQALDFTILQGSRIVLNVADFDGDGIADLLVGDTFANLWVFRSSQPGSTESLHPGQLLMKLPTRPESIACADWNEDGLVDLLIGGSATEPCLVYYNASKPGKPKVKPAEAITGLPYLFWGPKLRAADWNRDGDVDLLVQSEFFSFWLERSFLNHGYRSAIVQSDNAGAPMVEVRASSERSP